MGLGRKQPFSPQINTPVSTPSSASRKKTFLPGDLLALSGAEEGGKLILTSQGFFFFLAFMFFRSEVGHRFTDLGKTWGRQ